MTFKNFWRKKNKKFLTSFLGIVFLVFVFFVPQVATATSTIEFANPSKFKDFMELVDAIAKFFISLAIPLTVMMIIIVAFLLLTAGGDPQKVGTAKTLALYTLIGFVLIILARAISSVIKYAVS